jgi:hypothetical protein
LQVLKAPPEHAVGAAARPVNYGERITMRHARDHKQMHVTVFLQTDSNQGQYLRTCARIRDVSMTRLAQILIDKIAEDHLTEAVLDDAGQHERRKSEHRFKETV